MSTITVILLPDTWSLINSLKADEFPTCCKVHAIQYVKDGQYLRVFNLTTSMAESYFSSLTPQGDVFDVVLIDMDDILPSNLHLTNLLRNCGNNWVEEAKHMAHMHILRFHIKLRASGWSLIFITRMPEKNRNATVEGLISAGYGNCPHLIMRSNDEMQMESREYLSRRRADLQNHGFRIASVISSQMDALTGSYLGKRNFKLANPIYFMLEPRVDVG